MTVDFWADPPWRGGRAGHRMGLRPIAAADWLADPIDDPTRRDKLRLLADPTAKVFAEMPQSRSAQHLLRTLIEAKHGAAPNDRPPLAAGRRAFRVWLFNGVLRVALTQPSLTPGQNARREKSCNR